VAYPLEISFSHLRYHVILGNSRSNRSSVIIEICQTILTPQAPPFRVTRGHWNWQGSIATYDFLLVFRSNYGPISYRFRDKERYMAKIFPPLVFNPPMRGLLWNFVMRWGIGKQLKNSDASKHLSYVTAVCGLPQLEWNLSSCIIPKNRGSYTRFHVWPRLVR